MELDRRMFIKGAAAGAASLVALGTFAGCSAKNDNSKTDTSESYKISETKNADVIVVGSGTTGAAAAARAAQLGLKTIVVEQAPVTGGTSVMAEGMFAVGSSMQKAEGININKSQLFTKTMDYHHWIPNGEILMTYFDESASNIAWLQSLGMKFAVVASLGMSEKTWHIYDPNGQKLEGKYFSDTFNAAVKKLGAEILLSTTAVKVVMKDNTVTGLICKKVDDTYLQINAPVVFFGTGGYSDNPAMMTKLAAADPKRTMPAGMGGRKGAGIELSQAVGAALAPYPGTVMYYGGNMPGAMFGTQLFCATSFQPLLWVNENGLRFTDEELSENNFSFSGNAQARQKRVVSILTKAQMDMFVNKGCIFGAAQYIARGTKLTDLWNQYNEQVKAGNAAIFESDTLDGLASKIKMDAAALKKTVATYNDYCAKGQDLGFSKNPAYLLPLESGPYYAFDLKVGYFTTVGGLKVDIDSRVLDENDNAIPGLYAGGCDAGGLYGDSYDVVICAGSQQGWGMQSGRRAAEHAKKYVGA